MVHRAGIEPDHPAAHRVEGHRIVAHEDQLQVEGYGREHPLLSRGDGVDGDEIGMDDLLQVGDLLVEPVVVVDEAVPVVLEPDVVLEREGHRGPGVGLELGEVDEIIAPCNGLRDENQVPQPLFLFQLNRDLSGLIKVIDPDPVFFAYLRISGIFEVVSGGDGDSRSLADSDLLCILMLSL